MTFSNSITVCFSKYGTFAGRASRSEFWWFYLFNILMSWGASIVGAIAAGKLGSDILSLIIGLVFLVPLLAVGCRRLHDIGKSGWWQLIMLTVIGIVVLWVLWALETQKEENEYGAIPEDKVEVENLSIEQST